MSSQVYHIPALLGSAIDGLSINPSGIYVDATFGGGGHSRAILADLGSKGKLYGFDRDQDAYANRIEDSRFTFVHSDFRYIRNFLRFYGEDKVDGVLADLGVSFHHFDSPERGFSFRADAPLDMRMNQDASLTAADVVADYSADNLSRIFRAYGDIKNPAPIVKAVISARTTKPISTTGELVNILTPLINPKQEKKDLAKIFQALRMEVNSETKSLASLLETLPRILKPGGRAVIITYHSIEDRMVKNFFRTGNIEGNQQKDFYGNIYTPWKLITKNPIVPDIEEIEENPRARSAKLRIAELKNI